MAISPVLRIPADRRGKIIERRDFAGRRTQRGMLRSVNTEGWQQLGARRSAQQAAGPGSSTQAPPALDCTSLRPDGEVHWCGRPAGQAPSPEQACE